MSRYTVTLKPGARDQLKTLDLQVRAALAEAILDLQFGLPETAEPDEVDAQRFSVYLPPVANGLRPFLVYRIMPSATPTNGSPAAFAGEVTVITVAQYATPVTPTPVPTPPPGTPSRYIVYDFIVQNFTLDEIDAVIFDLGRDVSDLDGESLQRDTKEELARELVQFCLRRGVLDKLVERLRARRPEVVGL